MVVTIPIGRLTVATPETMAQSIRANTVATTAVDERISDVAAGIIAGDPTIITAAENAAVTAVDGALADADVLLGSDPQAVRQLTVDHPIWASVILSFDYRVVGGTLRSGGVVEERAGYAPVVLETGEGTVFLTYDYRRVEPGAESATDGLVSQGVLDEWASRMGAGGQQGFTEFTGWGDSMTTDYSGIGSNQTALLAAALGVTGYDMGVSADTPYETAFRAGGLDLRVTIADGNLPASGTVAVTVNRPLGWLQARSWTCEMRTRTGEWVTVTLAHAAVADMGVAPTWTLAQVGGTGVVQIAPDTRVRFIVDRAVTLAPAKIWVGRNDVTRAVEAVKLIVSQHRDPLHRRLISPVFNSASEPSGSAGYTNVMAVNDQLADLYPGDFFDSRAALIAHGLDLAGITPTAADTTAIGEDRIPPSLMLDTLHLNAAGRQALARIDANEISGRNW